MLIPFQGMWYDSVEESHLQGSLLRPDGDRFFPVSASHTPGYLACELLGHCPLHINVGVLGIRGVYHHGPPRG